MISREYLDLLERMPYVGDYKNISVGSYKKEDIIDVFGKIKVLRKN